MLNAVTANQKRYRVTKKPVYAEMSNVLDHNEN